MRCAGWLVAIVAIGPLIGQALAERSRIGEIVPKVEFKDIRFLRRNLSDLGEHKGFALVFLNAECPVSRRFAPNCVHSMPATLTRAFNLWVCFARPETPSWRWRRSPWIRNCASRS